MGRSDSSECSFITGIREEIRRDLDRHTWTRQREWLARCSGDVDRIRGLLWLLVAEFKLPVKDILPGIKTVCAGTAIRAEKARLAEPAIA